MREAKKAQRLGRLRETHGETRRRHALEYNAADVAAVTAVDLEPYVDNRVGAVFLGFAGQGLDCGLTVGFGPRIARGAPLRRRSDAANRGHRPAAVEVTRKAHVHDVQVRMLKRRLHSALGLSRPLTSRYGLEIRSGFLNGPSNAPARNAKRGAGEAPLPCDGSKPMRLFGRRGRLRSGRLFEVGAGLLVDDPHRQLDLAPIVVAQDLDLDPVAFLDDVGRLVDPRLRKLRNVDEAVLRSEEIDEGAELDRLDHRSVINLADLRLRGDRLDPVDGRLDLRAVARRDLHSAVVLDVDLGPGLFHDLPDDLAARADHLANLVGRDLHGLDARRKLAELGPGAGDRLAHFAENMHAAVTRLSQCLAHDLLGDAGDLDVHLQRSDAFAGAGDLEIHVAEMVLVAENVAEHGEARALENEPHRNARDRALERHARVHQRQRRAADRGHRRRAVRLGDLRDDADRVGEFGRGRQHRMDRPPGELAVADFAPAGRAHAAGFADRIWGEVIVEQEPLLVGA